MNSLIRSLIQRKEILRGILAICTIIVGILSTGQKL